MKYENARFDDLIIRKEIITFPDAHSAIAPHICRLSCPFSRYPFNASGNGIRNHRGAPPALFSFSAGLTITLRQMAFLHHRSSRRSALAQTSKRPSLHPFSIARILSASEGRGTVAFLLVPQKTSFVLYFGRGACSPSRISAMLLRRSVLMHYLKN